MFGKGKLTILLVFVALVLTAFSSVVVADEHENGENATEFEPVVEFDDQDLDDEGTVGVSVNNETLNQSEAIVLTYQWEDRAGGPRTVVVGVSELDNETNVRTEVEDDEGYPGQHTAHAVAELSGYEPGDREVISDPTVDSVVAQDSAEVSDEFDPIELEEEEDDETEPSVTFEDQVLGEDGTVGVSVNEDSLEEGEFLVVTYEEDGDLVIAGFDTLGDETELSIEVEDAGGFPGTHTAHVVCCELSTDYEPGDVVSEETAENVLVNEDAEVTEEEEDDEEVDDEEVDDEEVDDEEVDDEEVDDEMDDEMDDDMDDMDDEMDDDMDDMDDEMDDMDEEEGLPGFTAVAALVALVAAAFLAKRE